MITALLFDRFQSIAEPCRLSLRDLTFLYGPNSSGKSSVLDVLKLFKDVAALKMRELDLSGAPIRNGKRESLSVGIEVTLDKVNKLDETDVHRFHRYEDALYGSDFDDKEFFKALKGKRICLKIVAGGHPADDDCLEIYINDRLFLRISNEASWFNPSLQIISSGEAQELQDPIFGYVFIDKTIDGYNWLDLWSSMRVAKSDFDSAIYEFFENETEERIEIRGLDLGLLNLTRFGRGGRLLIPNLSNEGHLGKWNRRDFSQFFESFYQSFTPSDVDRLRAHNREWVKKVSEDATERWTTINAALWSWCDKLSLLLEAFLLRISADLSFSAVPGERSIIDSSAPFSYARDGSYSRSDNSVERHESLPRYFSKFFDDNKNKPVADEESDIVNVALGSLMPSLGRYSMRPLISKIVPMQCGGESSQELNFTDGDGYFFGEGYTIYPYLLSNSMPKTAINFKDIGSGVSFVFPILTAIDRTSLVVIEQPELHLHPRAQCEIGDVFLYGINQKKRLIVESHSEHVLLRVSRRIRETSRKVLINPNLKLTPDQVIVHYFKPNGDGTSKIHTIRFDREGDFLDLWPDGFFAERESEIFDE